MSEIPVDRCGRALAMAFTRNIGPKLDGELVSNALLARHEMLSSLLDPRRDIDAECHYPATRDVTPEQYKQLYDRNEIACRVVQCMARESWQGQPTVFEAEDPDVTTPFEEAWDALQPMTGGLSWYKAEEAGSVWEYLLRADILSGIGHFGVLLMGFDDGKNLQEPVEGAMTNNAFGNAGRSDCYLTKTEEDNLRKLDKLNDQETAVLNQLARQREMVLNYAQAQQDRRSQRGQSQQDPVFGSARDEHDPPTTEEMQGTDRQYGQEFGMRGEADYSPDQTGTDQQYFGVQFGPTEQPTRSSSPSKLKLLFLRPFDESLVQIVRYEWNINNPRFGMPVMYRITLNDPREQHSGIGLPMATVFVHWSRVIHLSDNLNSSEIFGAPRMRPVLNRLLDLQKIYGASAEGYWQAAFTGLSLETHPQLGGDVTIDSADVRDQIENYVNSLQRYLALTGMSAKTLAPAVSDPTSQITGHIEAICIQMGIPVRIFKGSERGELASSQDDASWNDRLKARQQGYITPRIIVPFVDRLIAVGVLPEPSYVEPVEEPQDEFGMDEFSNGFGMDESDTDGFYESGEQVFDDLMSPEEQKEGDEQNIAPETDQQTQEWQSPKQFSSKPALDKKPNYLAKMYESVVNTFCKTGEGGGIDPSCGKSKSEGEDTWWEEADQSLNEGVEEYQFPKVMYHVTSGDRVSLVSKQGLKVGKARSTEVGKIAGVYLTDDPVELFGAGDFNPKNMHIVEIDTSQLKIRFDPEFYANQETAEEVHQAIKDKEAGTFVYSKKSIPKSAIKSIRPVEIGRFGWSYTDSPVGNLLQRTPVGLTKNVFKESEHPRADDGKFGEGSGGKRGARVKSKPGPKEGSGSKSYQKYQKIQAKRKPLDEKVDTGRKLSKAEDKEYDRLLEEGSQTWDKLSKAEQDKVLMGEGTIKETEKELRTVPKEGKTKHSMKQLDKSSQAAGEFLFGKPTGRWGSGAESAPGHTTGVVTEKTKGVEHYYLSDRIGVEEGADMVDDWEYVFFPSTGKGLDVSGQPWASATKKWADKDGKIYSKYGNTVYVTVID